MRRPQSRQYACIIDAPCVLASHDVPRVIHRGNFPARPLGSRHMSVVASHMSRDLLTVGPDDRLGEAAKRMVARGVGAVLVMEGGAVAGIISIRDLMRVALQDMAPRGV